MRRFLAWLDYATDKLANEPELTWTVSGASKIRGRRQL